MPSRKAFCWDAGFFAAGQFHFLDFDGLNAPDVTFWSVWQDDSLLGCGARGQLSPDHGEIKSMRTDAAHLGKGVGTQMLRHIIAESKLRGYQRLSLETGSSPAFDAAHALYLRFGFAYCPPFGDYHSVAMRITHLAVL